MCSGRVRRLYTDRHEGHVRDCPVAPSAIASRLSTQLAPDGFGVDAHLEDCGKQLRTRDTEVIRPPFALPRLLHIDPRSRWLGGCGRLFLLDHSRMAVGWDAARRRDEVMRQPQTASLASAVSARSPRIPRGRVGNRRQSERSFAARPPLRLLGYPPSIARRSSRRTHDGSSIERYPFARDCGRRRGPRMRRFFRCRQRRVSTRLRRIGRRYVL